jgi:hypothetical protein
MEMKIDLALRKTVLEGNKADRESFKKRVQGYINNLSSEQAERKRINAIRNDFLLGNQAQYTNVIGLTKKEKKGHTNATFNYAGRTCVKLYYGLANNPPNIKIPGIPVSTTNLKRESLRAQGVEDFIDHIFYINHFIHHTFPRAVMNQIATGGAGVKVYYDSKDKLIKVIQKENTNNLLVGWRGDDAASYDFVIDVEERTVDSVEKEFGIKILKSLYETPNTEDETTSTGSHHAGEEYATKERTSTQAAAIPSGKTSLPKVKVVDYWDDETNMIMVNDVVVQYVKHTWGFNPWEIIPNIHIPNKPWGLSDIDYLIDPQIEYNEASNDERDFIRAAVNIKYVAKNMEDFDPESIKTGSGQVIFIQGDDSDFSAMPQPVNTFPAESYLTRVKKAIHDLGIPEVAYGTGQSDSGRSKAIDYQSMVDVIEDKRRAWILALNRICERVQILGYKYFPVDFFKNPDSDEFEVRPVELDWSDIVPLTSSERVVNVVNKLQAGAISLATALHELGYKDVDAEIDKLKEEERDPELATIRHKVVELIPGVKEASDEKQQEQLQLAQEAQANAGGIATPPKQAQPTLTTGQNQEGALPMAQPGSSTAFGSPKGFISQMGQNMNEQGQ